MSKIVTLQKEEVNFSYTSMRYTQPLGTDLEVYQFNKCDDKSTLRSIGDALTERRQNFHGVRLAYILAQTGRIDFAYDTVARLDNPRTNRLAGITVRNSESAVLKSIALTHEYFRTPFYSSVDTATQYLHARLKLLRIQEAGLPPYVFSYKDSTLIPQRLSFAQDHYGYHNGQVNNTNLIGAQGYFYHANREPAPTQNGFALLETVRFPTGGYQRFTYETPSRVDYETVHIPREDLNLSAGPDTVVRAKMILHSSRNRTIGWSLPADKRGCRSTITITSSTNPEYQFHAYGTSGGVSAFLKKGVYTVIINNGHCVDGTGFIAVRWDSTAIGHTTTPLYGVRCKKIAYYTTDKRLAKVTSFQYGAAHSMVLQPYQRTMYEVKDNASYSGFICSWTVFMASQVYTLGFPEAPHYYENITQYEDSLGTQGKKTYLYSFANDIVSNAIPGLVPTNYGWLRGQLKRVDYYTRADTAFRPLRTTEYVYNTLHNSDEFWDFQNSPKTQHDVNILGLYVRRILTGNSNAAGGCNIYDYGYYKLPSAVQYLSKQIDTWYTPTGIHQNTKRYYVTNFTHLQPSVTTQILSATDSLVTRTTYAADYISTAPSPDAPSEALATLNRQHRLTTPIEEVTFRMGRLTQATLRTYRPLTIPVLDKLYRAEVAIPTSAFVAATSMNGKFVFNPTYREALAYDIYNRASEPLQITANKHQTQAYLWNETHQQLVAVVRNAYYSQVAVTSFELGSTGRWQYDSTGYHVQVGGYTGQRAYRLDGQWGIRREQLPAGEYELTYWQQGSSIPQLYCSSNGKVVGGGRILLATNPQGWQQFRTRLQFAGTGSVKIDVNAGDLLTLDELRLIPIGARATSYTYKTLVGETSQTGPDGRTIFYDYDTLGRLIRTRDEQGRILSQQQYHYAGAK